MKKIVPDPPSRKPVATPFFTVQSDSLMAKALMDDIEIAKNRQR
ncbi:MULTISPECIES: hypothetical protein [Pseudomonas]|jgi:hypothetical protein|nr:MULTISPECIES: hypothetical protein [Pseudomonas]